MALAFRSMRPGGLLAAVIASLVLVPSFAEPPAAEPATADEVVPPQVILESQKAPVYPPAALAGRFTGTVVLELKILPDGSVGEVAVVNCSHRKLGFEEAAVAAVKEWRFEPALREGEPVEFSAKYRLNFRGEGSGRGFQPFVSAGVAGLDEERADDDERQRRRTDLPAPTTPRADPKG